MALRSRFEAAQAAFKRRDFSAAKVMYDALIEDYPAFRDYYFRDLGRMVLLQTNLKDEATAGLTPSEHEAVALCMRYATQILQDPGTIFEGWAYYFKARAFLALGRPEEAESELSLALAGRNGPPESVLHYYLGRALEASQIPDDAYMHYKLAGSSASGTMAVSAGKAVERVGANLEPEERLIDWQLLRGELARKVAARSGHDVLQEIREAIKECPFSDLRLDLRRLEGLYYLRLNRRKEAYALLHALFEDELQAGRPRWETIDPLQSDLGKRDKQEERLALLRRFIEGKPDQDGVPAYFLLAYYLKDEGRYEEAEALYREVWLRFPKHPRWSEARWSVLWGPIRRQDWPSALEALRSALLSVPEGSDDEAQIRYWLARVLEITGQADKGSVVLEDVHYRFPFSYYGILAGWRIRGGPPKVWGPAVLEPSIADPGFQAEDPAEMALGLLFPGFSERLERVKAKGPARHLEKAKELWLMGQETASRRELYAGAYHPDAKPQARWIAAALRHMMGSFYFGIQYGLHYAESLNAEDKIEPARLALAFPMPYREAIFRRALEHGVEPALVASVIREESLFQADAGSRAGARGLMQLMPLTGRIVSRWLEIRNYRSCYLLKPDFSLRLGAEYLSVLLEKNGGSLIRALASYNAGPATVGQWEKRFGAMDDDCFAEEIPYRETRYYVRKTIRNLEGYLKAYGAHLVPRKEPVEEVSGDPAKTAPAPL